MNKLYLVTALFIAVLVGKAFAGEDVDTPYSGVSNPINADYGGVDVATNSFYVGLTTVPTGNGPQGITYNGFYASTTTKNGLYSQTKWRIYGVNFSTGPCGNNDFISVQVSSASATQAREIVRFWNVYNSSGTAVAGVGAMTGSCSGIQTTRWPIRAYGNLFFGVNQPSGSSNIYNRADLLYWMEP